MSSQETANDITSKGVGHTPVVFAPSRDILESKNWLSACFIRCMWELPENVCFKRHPFSSSLCGGWTDLIRIRPQKIAHQPVVRNIKWTFDVTKLRTETAMFIHKEIADSCARCFVFVVKKLSKPFFTCVVPGQVLTNPEKALHAYRRWCLPPKPLNNIRKISEKAEILPPSQAMWLHVCDLLFYWSSQIPLRPMQNKKNCNPCYAICHCNRRDFEIAAVIHACIRQEMR